MMTRRRALPEALMAPAIISVGLPIVAGIALAVGLFSARPGDPATQVLGFGGSPESRATLIAEERAHHRFHISGSVSGLYPGGHRRLRLTVTNPMRSAIVVRSVNTTVSSPSKACPSSYVRVRRFTGHLHVAAHHSRILVVRVRMLYTAPNGCQGAHFPFQYHGTASQA